MAMSDAEELQRLVHRFADSVIRQTEAMGQGDYRTGNRYAGS